MELDDQSAQSHADTVETWMKLDNIWEMAQRHLTSVATDGASNMISQGNAQGTGGGFCKLLSDKIESRDLLCLHCMAHQLQVCEYSTFDICALFAAKFALICQLISDCFNFGCE